MSVAFVVLSAITIVGVAGAMILRNLVHCVLSLSAGLVGLAGLYLALGAQFVGLTQILVYVGAVAILAIFAIMMTRGAEPTPLPASRAHWLRGSLIAGLLFALVGWAIIHGIASISPTPPAPEASVRSIGNALMHRFVMPLEIVGVLLTAALIGAGVLAMDDTREGR
jgi:NADH-quinone oxidoreductase subunit J